MFLLLAAHLGAVVGAPVLVHWWGRRAFYVLAALPAAVAIWAGTLLPTVLHQPHTESVVWVAELGLELAFRIDALSVFLLLIVGGVGALVLVYSASYFAPNAAGLGRFAAAFIGFAGAMLGLVTTDDLVVLFIFWELTTVTSYLLIGHYADRKTSRRAALQAIVVTTAGGLVMLVGLLVLGAKAHTWSISELVSAPPAPTPVVLVAVVLVLVGAVTKAALVPFHYWLPAAMAAPTPVSAYLHAAAMVKAGVYLIARLAPAFADLPVWHFVVLFTGLTTMLLGGYRALRQHDLKLILAFGTVSQLGLMVVLVGSGNRAMALAGLAALGAHAMFKAALFLIVGVVDAAAGTRDLRRLSGVGRALPWTAGVAALAVASMIGFPPLAGYVAKEAALQSLTGSWPTLSGAGWSVPPVFSGVDTFVALALVAGAVLTAAYGLRLWWGAFGVRVLPEPTVVTRPSLLMLVPAGVLAVLGLALGLVPQLAQTLLGPYAATYQGGAVGHLGLWAGFNWAFVLTVLVLLGGAGLFWARERVERWQEGVWHPPSADSWYWRTLRRLDDVAADVTAAVQRGSSPVYLGLILVVFVVAVGVPLATGTHWPVGWPWSDGVVGSGSVVGSDDVVGSDGAATSGRVVGSNDVGGADGAAGSDDAFRPSGAFSSAHWRWWDRPAQVPLVLVAVVAAVLVARSRRRLKGALLLGVVGYAVAGLFLVHGAPDLALTQVLVETVTLVVFVLVFRRLPPYFSQRPLAASRWMRLGVGVAVGLVVGAIAVIVPGARVADPVGYSLPEQAAAAGGSNVVNVTLVDLRAWDTVGEISVLLVAATGVASLVFVSRRTGRIFRTREADPERVVWGGGDDPTAALRRQPVAYRPATAARNTEWLRAGRTLAPRRRSVLFEVVVRLVYHAMIVYSVFLMVTGHNAPGGGFAAGLVTGIALTIRYLAGGRYELGEAAPVQAGAVLGAGLFVAAGTGVVSMLFGLPILTSTVLHWQLPLVGEIHLATSLFFDLGVYLVVVGLVLDLLRTLGAELDRRAETGEDPAFDQNRGAR